METKAWIQSMRGKMQKARDHTLHQFATLHTGKATPAMVENINIEVYGSVMKLKEMASISTPDVRTISIQPWDKANLKAIEKAILLANIGLNAVTLGDTVRCPVPELSRERRQELVKVAHGMTEEGRVHIRNIRRETLEQIRKVQKSFSEDEIKNTEKEIQKWTDEFVSELGKLLEAKEKELLQL
jgi:ribosome recycling factor